MHPTLPFLTPGVFPAIRRGRLETLQVNLGYRCNQACLHCHVNAGPRRKEVMRPDTLEDVIRFLDSAAIRTLDLTGGAPELNPGFRRLVTAAFDRGKHVIDRCNLTVLLEPGQEDTARFLAARRVEVIASLPCYIQENVDRQRGDGVFAASIEALRFLNELGYGHQDTGLELSLVYNPQGPELPPPQPALERDYRNYLAEHYNVVFSRLLTLTNMPINRFGSTLITKGQFSAYMDLLKGAHQEANLAGVMCRSLVSIDWQGYVYDCDFNQMLGLPSRLNGCSRTHIRELRPEAFEHAEITVADHCYGCTAGQGSSCGGALEI